ncbi:membrane protein YdbS with pleckstrin-like domain [Arthrobacter pigmenti]|uniref:Membrane protein YdbS with pleckstrin-like domain n=1 Tax=Arthrobacter pigmenti TaxID=271432 RepID=A0A846RL42_9MICC|nr:DUF3054 domain-containing protein [Arthrobacter pigmenti]NJC22390.1 membrane protein YdbS with pleckstrin-like domain [Arthrobacter pigmenti]
MTRAPAQIRLVWALVDIALILVFAFLGQASHYDAVSLPGALATAAPFLAAYSMTYLACLAWRRPAAPLRTGVPMWLGTAVGGLMLRVWFGESAAPAFQIVAVVVLALFLVFPRLVAATLGAVRRRRRRQSSAHHSPAQNQGAAS